MVNIFPPDHVDDLPEVEPNQPELVLVGENEELEEEEEFEDEEEFEEEEPQKEEEDMEVDIEEEENESELIFPYVEADPLNPPPTASDSEFEDVVEVEDIVEHEDETVPNSVHAVGESSTATFLREDVCGRETAHALVKKKGKAKDKYYGKLIADLGDEVRCSVGEREVALEDIIKDFGNAKERVECKKLKKGLEEARPSNTLLSFLLRHDRIMPPNLRPLTQAAVERMIASRVNEAMIADRARRVNVSGAGGSRQGEAPATCECTFSGFMKCNPIVFHGKKVKFVAAILQGPALTWWNTKVATMGLEAVNQIPWTKMKQMMTAEFFPAEEVQNMEHEMVKPENVKVDAYIRGLSENIKFEVTSLRPTNLNEAVRMAHKLMEQKI
ncbi:hypothetical protein Tco_0635619 [Tanacetum coccineum]